MIILQTTREKFEKGKALLIAQGGRLSDKTRDSGTVSFRLFFQEIKADYSFNGIDLTLKLLRVPIFVTEQQIVDYLQGVLG